MIKVLALTVKPERSPDTRYRILQYVQSFRRDNIEVDHRSFISERFYGLFLAPGKGTQKMFYYAWAYLKLYLFLVFRLRSYDAVWILRELSPIGPPIMEKLVLRYHPHVILDIDDAIYIPDQASKGFIHHRLRDFQKFEKTAKHYHTVVCGNRFLADYFEKLGARVKIIPTVVKAGLYNQVSHQPAEKVRIGWLGTPQNIVHLEVVRKAIERLTKKHDCEFVVVGLNRRLDWDTDRIRYVTWELARELEYLGMFDIGVMPLQDYEFVKGKCAFKLIQYMAAGVPVVASPVGANLEVVEDGINGFFADTDLEWEEKLGRLITDAELRKAVGQKGTETVAERYSLEGQWPVYSQLLRKGIDRENANQEQPE